MTLKGSVSYGFAAIALGMISPVSQAAVVENSASAVVVMHSYSTTGGGDIFFKTADMPATCWDGFYLRASDPGFKNTLAVLLGAYYSRALLKVYAYDNELWSGSSGHVCRVDSVGHVAGAL